MRRYWGWTGKPPAGAPRDPAWPHAAGLFDLLPLNEGAGVVAFNLAAPTAPGSTDPANPASWRPSPGPAGRDGVAAFVGGGAAITVPDHGNIVAGDFAVRIVHRPVSWGNLQAIVDKGTSSARQLSIFCDSSGNINYLAVGTGGGSVSIPTAMAVNGTWDLVLSRSGSTITAYVNGRAAGTATISSTGAAGNPALSLGGNPSAGGLPYFGSYHLFATWRRALTAAEVAALAADPYGAFLPPGRPRRMAAAPAPLVGVHATFGRPGGTGPSRLILTR